LLGGIHAQPGEQELVGPRDPRGRVSQAFPVGVLPYGGQYLANGPLDTGQIYPVFGWIPLFGVFEKRRFC